jgi:hypothetical protein
MRVCSVRRSVGVRGEKSVTRFRRIAAVVCQSGKLGTNSGTKSSESGDSQDNSKLAWHTFGNGVAARSPIYPAARTKHNVSSGIVGGSDGWEILREGGGKGEGNGIKVAMR